MGKALLDGKVVEREVSKYEEISGIYMYVHTFENLESIAEIL